jgi:hypothetical protein
MNTTDVCTHLPGTQLPDGVLIRLNDDIAQRPRRIRCCPGRLLLRRRGAGLWQRALHRRIWLATLCCRRCCQLLRICRGQGRRQLCIVGTCRS